MNKTTFIFKFTFEQTYLLIWCVSFSPFTSFTSCIGGTHSSGKAARQMYFRVLALEEAENDPMLTVLNYQPGPVQTEMTHDIEENAVAADVRKIFKGMREEKTILQPIDTAIKFIKIIELGDYDSGASIDYYD